MISPDSSLFAAVENSNLVLLVPDTFTIRSAKS